MATLGWTQPDRQLCSLVWVGPVGSKICGWISGAGFRQMQCPEAAGLRVCASIGWEKLGHDNKRGNEPITIQEGGICCCCEIFCTGG